MINYVEAIVEVVDGGEVRLAPAVVGDERRAVQRHDAVSTVRHFPDLLVRPKGERRKHLTGTGFVDR